MRIEEIQNNMYIKSTDSVEKYLLNIIQEYFRDSNEALEGSREYIIREAVDRLKTEMDYNSLGVLSVTLPDGNVRTGDITITLEDLGGEPMISPKLSAFNVNFGDIANTACEGNDPRLYNARKPIKHEHEISDIRGLEGILSTIINMDDRNNVYIHEHNNKNLLDILCYTGKKTSIDLNIIDTLESKIDEVTEEIRNKIIQYIEDTDAKIEEINKEIIAINDRIDKIYEYVITKCEEYLATAKQYTDEVIEASKIELTNYIETNYVKKQSIAYLIDIAKTCYTLVNTDTWQISSLAMNTNENIRLVDLQFSQITMQKLSERHLDLPSTVDVIFNLYIEYEENNETIRQPIPYADNFSLAYQPYMFPFMQNLTIPGYLEAFQKHDNTLQLAFHTSENQLPTEILNGKIVCDIFARPYCPVYYY